MCHKDVYLITSDSSRKAMSCRMERCNRPVCRGVKSTPHFRSVESLQTYNPARDEDFMTDPGDKLHEAIKADSVRFTSWVLRSGQARRALIKVVDGHVALHEAAQRGKLPIVRLLLDTKLHGAAALSPRTRHADYTPLMVAVYRAHDAVVEALAHAGADLDAQTHRHAPHAATRGHAALHLAARRADPNTLHLLLLLGARADLRTAHGETADDVARQFGRPAHRRILREFARHPRLNIPHLVLREQPQLVVRGVLNLPLGLLHGAAHDQVDTVRYFLGVRPGLLRNARDVWGRTALHVAAAKGAANVARELLLVYRANPTVRTSDGRTAYQLAKDNRHRNVLRVLEEYDSIRGRGHGW